MAVPGTPVMQAKSIPQNILNCDNKSATLDCLMSENLNINHAEDLIVECQDHDPTDPTREDGVMEMWTP